MRKFALIEKFGEGFGRRDRDGYTQLQLYKESRERKVKDKGANVEILFPILPTTKLMSITSFPR